MNTRAVLLTSVVLLGTADLVQAQEGALHGTIDVTYLSSYIWRGFDAYPQGHSAIQPSIDLDMYGTGLGVKVFSSRANRSGFENDEWLDVTLSYRNSFFDGENYMTDYCVGWVYYNYPDNSRKASDLQEAFVVFSWPRIFPAGLVPRYTLACAWPAKSDSPNASDDGGWVHVFGLEYDLAAPALLPNTTPKILHLSAEVVYNDGIGPAGEVVDHDWSHTVFGVSTDFNLSNNLIFTPAFYYQASMDDSVNTEDETWCGLSMRYKF